VNNARKEIVLPRAVAQCEGEGSVVQVDEKFLAVGWRHFVEEVYGLPLVAIDERHADVLAEVIHLIVSGEILQSFLCHILDDWLVVPAMQDGLRG
jgi:hypothetical protein